MLQGHVPAHIDYLDLEIAVKLQDGREIIQPIRLWTKTGVIEPLPAQKASIGAGENRRADAEATSPIDTKLSPGQRPSPGRVTQAIERVEERRGSIRLARLFLLPAGSALDRDRLHREGRSLIAKAGQNVSGSFQNKTTG